MSTNLFRKPALELLSDLEYRTSLLKLLKNGISSSQSEVAALKENGGLQTNMIYAIGDTESGPVYVTAINPSTISADGYRSLMCPATYKEEVDAAGNVWKGIWFDTMAGIAVGNLVIWGARVWKSKTGATGFKYSDYELDPNNWELISPLNYAKGEYVEMVFQCNYDLQHNWVSKQRDMNGNEVGYDYHLAQNMIGDTTYNPCDYTDWNWGSTGLPFFSNKVWQILNNRCTGINENVGGYIKGNNIGGTIDANVSQMGIYFNANGGSISFNHCNEIMGNLHTGDISYNKCGFAIAENQCQGSISYNNLPLGISGNANAGRIYYNTNGGGILNNTNQGVIENNKNNGNIENNSVQGHIQNNANNGHIRNNTSAVAVAIFSNVNNGNIGGASGTMRNANITDAVTDK